MEAELYASVLLAAMPHREACVWSMVCCPFVSPPPLRPLTSSSFSKSSSKSFLFSLSPLLVFEDYCVMLAYLACLDTIGNFLYDHLLFILLGISGENYYKGILAILTQKSLFNL